MQLRDDTAVLQRVRIGPKVARLALGCEDYPKDSNSPMYVGKIYRL